VKNFIISIIFVTIGALLLQGAGCQSSEFSTAKMALQQKDLKKAEDFLEKELAKNPNNAEAYSLMSDIKTQKGEYVDAAKALAKANELARAGKDKKMVEKIDFQMINGWQLAYGNSFTYYNNYNSEKDATKKRAFLDTAISLCDVGMILRPENNLFPSQKAYFLELAGDTAEAIRYYQKHIDLLQKDVDFAKSKGLKLNSTREDALKAINGEIVKTRIDTLGMDKDRKDTGEYRYNDQIKVADGKEVFLSSELKKDQKELKGLVVKGWIYNPNPDLRIEEKSMFNSITLEPYFYLSQINFEKAEYTAAIDYLKMVTSIEPDNKVANSSIVKLYELSGNTNVAFEELEQLIAENPDKKEYYFQYAELLTKVKKYNEAIKQFDKAINIDREYDWALYGLGAVYKNKASEMQQTQQAKKEKNSKFQIDPKEYFPQLTKSAEYFAKSLTTTKFKDNFEVLAELASIYTILEEESKLNAVIANLEKIEYTLPKNQKETYYLEMVKIFSFRKDEAKTQKWQTKYEKLTSNSSKELDNEELNIKSFDLDYELFEEIQNGMSLKEVKLLLKSNGKLLITYGEGKELNETYEWKSNDGYKSIAVSFQNEKVISKTQIGL